jgi:hypothetical protein
MDRDSSVYQQQKLANELIGSDGWLLLLKPMLERKAKDKPLSVIESMDMAFKTANALAEQAVARSILAQIDRLAVQFQKGDG